MSVFVFDEMPGSRRSTSDPPGLEIRYVCAGEFDSGAVKASAINLTPILQATAEGILVRKNIDLQENGYKNYTVVVTWGEQGGQNNPPPLGQYTFQFTTSGGTLHISHSQYPTHEIYQPGGGTLTKDMHKQAIDPEPPDMKPRGTEMVVPVCKFSYTFKHPSGFVNESHAQALARLTGVVNSATWHGIWAAGELLYIGSEGGDGSNTEAEITYHFVAQENLTGLTIGAITGIAKEGHDFLWVWWEPTTVSSQPATKPKAVFIERLYRRVNYQAVFGF